LGPVNTPAFSDESHIRRIDPNNGPFTIMQIRRVDPNAHQGETVRQIKWKPSQTRFSSGRDRPFSIKYDTLQFCLTSRVLIPIELPGGKRSAIVDTGFGGHVYMNDAMVESCDLAVFPLHANPETGSAVGLCEIPSLSIGPMTTFNPPCVYDQMQWQFRVLGVPLYRHRIVLLGLDFMRLFTYVHFNNVRHEIMFSPHDPFEPSDASNWVRLPFTLERIDDNLRMMVNLPFGDSKVHVEFDTGGAKPGLTLRESAWQRVAPSLHARDWGPGHYPTYQYGPFPCRKYTIPRLSIGRIALKHAAVDALPDDSPLMRDVDGILSLDYFKNTTAVLDFKKSQIWIKQP
jgi:hypothetical protein